MVGKLLIRLQDFPRYGWACSRRKEKRVKKRGSRARGGDVDSMDCLPSIKVAQKANGH